MDTSISNLPLGLLSLLGIKSMGEYPKTMAGMIAPTLDVMSMISITNSELVVGVESFGLNSASGVNSLTVPTLLTGNEWILVTEFSTYVRMAPAAANSCGGFRLGYTDNTTYGFHPFPTILPMPGDRVTGAADTVWSSYAANERIITLECSQAPFLIPPREGGQIMYNKTSNVVVAAATIDFCYSMRVIRLRT